LGGRAAFPAARSFCCVFLNSCLRLPLAAFCFFFFWHVRSHFFVRMKHAMFSFPFRPFFLVPFLALHFCYFFFLQFCAAQESRRCYGLLCCSLFRPVFTGLCRSPPALRFSLTHLNSVFPMRSRPLFSRFFCRRLSGGSGFRNVFVRQTIPAFLLQVRFLLDEAQVLRFYRGCSLFIFPPTLRRVAVTFSVTPMSVYFLSDVLFSKRGPHDSSPSLSKCPVFFFLPSRSLWRFSLPPRPRTLFSCLSRVPTLLVNRIGDPLPAPLVFALPDGLGLYLLV